MGHIRIAGMANNRNLAATQEECGVTVKRKEVEGMNSTILQSLIGLAHVPATDTEHWLGKCGAEC